MKKSFLRTTLSLTFLIALTPSTSFAIGPQLQFDCGNWNYLKDSKGKYRELSTQALYYFSGSEFKYNIDYYGSKRDFREKTSSASFIGSHVIESPEYSSRTLPVPISKKFRNNKMDMYMYKTKYLRAEIVFIDEIGFEARASCIWKWS